MFRTLHTVWLLTAPINTNPTEAFQSNPLHGEGFTMKGFAWARKMKLTISDLCCSAEKLEKYLCGSIIAWAISSLIPTFWPVKNTFRLWSGPRVELPAAELEVVCHDPQNELLLLPLQIRNTAAICIQGLHWSHWLQKGSVWTNWVTVEYAVWDIIYSEI